MRSRAGHRHHLKQSGVKAMFSRLSFAVIVLVICVISLLSTIKSTSRSFSQSEVSVSILRLNKIFILHISFAFKFLN
ncbi:O-fucosyltransferase 1-like [Olea europaea subsp. europaea]|uniref:O-fucosyltransferase 1-like n=1 Tax=Olea europaea subsp. europaea TaxID=158383 RepID=A0A8S0T6N3_OLEEU|nr:O-fucosyltransferase 1-like [Olea europaea subsp. europaea]